MERRQFLGVSVGAVALGSACASAGPLEGGAAADEHEHGLAALDRAMAQVDGWKLPKHLARGTGAAAAAVDAQEDALRKGLRSLVLVGALHDMPEELRGDEAVQARLWRAIPDMDEAVLATHARLKQLDATKRKAIHERLAANPGLALEVVQPILDDAARISTPWTGRARLRTLATQAAWLLEKQGPTPFIQDFDARVKKAARSALALGPLQRELRARMGEEAFWQHQQKLASFAAVPDAVADNGERWQRESRDDDDGLSTSDTVATVGGAMMGVGLILGLIGLATTGGAGLATIGALVLLIGLVVLVIGLVLLAE